MALTAEQQAQIEYETALFTARELARETAKETARETAKIKVEMVRLAKEVLTENARSKPVDTRDVSAADIQAFAQTLVAYINS